MDMSSHVSDDVAAFCGTYSTNMYMNGFHVNKGCSGDPPYFDSSGASIGSKCGDASGCIMLWFPAWTLDSSVKFGFGCVGVVILAIATQGVVFVRNHPSLKSPRFIRNPLARDVVNVALYALNMFLAYFLMLAAMTYNVEIFISMMIGIILGFVIFNVAMGNGRAAGGTFCCSDQTELNDLASQDNSSGSVPAVPQSGHVRSEIIVEGMTCASCVRTVRQAMLTTNGVSACSVGLKSMIACVDHSPETSATELAQVIVSVGYSGSVLVDGNGGNDEVARRQVAQP